MPLEAVQNLSLTDQVFAQLAAEILAGRYASEDALPPERELSRTFGVNRHVVREALKRLAQANLIKIAQGGATRVLDFRQHAGLELLTLMADHQPRHEQGLGAWLSVLEMRAGIAPEVVRLCAQRASAAVRSELVEITTRMAAASDDQELYALEVRFWERVLVGADNLAYRLAFNSLVKSAYRLGATARALSLHEVRSSGYRVTLARAIAAGHTELAERDTRKRMRADLERLRASFEQGATGSKQDLPAKVRAARSEPVPAAATRSKRGTTKAKKRRV
jgi:GntR family transcriptional regulator, transcriptional repressor for pyruvate dehydrogenase complex